MTSVHRGAPPRPYNMTTVSHWRYGGRAYDSTLVRLNPVVFGAGRTGTLGEHNQGHAEFLLYVASWGHTTTKEWRTQLAPLGDMDDLRKHRLVMIRCKVDPAFSAAFEEPAAPLRPEIPRRVVSIKNTNKSKDQLRRQLKRMGTDTAFHQPRAVRKTAQPRAVRKAAYRELIGEV